MIQIRPATTTNTITSKTAVKPILDNSLRRKLVKEAPTIVNANPAAASGVNQGTIPIKDGKINPIAPKISTAALSRSSG